MPALAWLPLVVIGTLLLAGLLRGKWRNQARILGHPIRAKILSVIDGRPGTNISELCRHLECQWGTMHHHLQILERARLIQGVFEGRTHRYFGPEIEPEEAARIALLRRRHVHRIVTAVLLRPGLIQRNLTADLAVSRKMVRSYIDLLVDSGLLLEVRESSRRRYYPTDALRRVMTSVPSVDAPGGDLDLGPSRDLPR